MERNTNMTDEQWRQYKEICLLTNIYFCMIQASDFILRPILQYSECRENREIKKLKYLHKEIIRNVKILRNINNDYTRIIEGALNVDQFSNLLSDANYFARLLCYIVDRADALSNSIPDRVESYIKKHQSKNLISSDLIERFFRQK